MGINFKEVKSSNSSSGGFEAIPSGRYDLIVESGELKTAKSGNPMIEFVYIIADGKYKNRKIWHNFSLVPNAQIFLLRFLEACGSDVVDDDSEVEEQAIIDSVIGARVSAYIKEGKTNKGNPRNDIEGNFKKADAFENTSSETTKSKLFS